MTTSCFHDTEKAHKIVKPKQKRSLEFTDGSSNSSFKHLHKVFSSSANSKQPEQDLAYSRNSMREKSVRNQATETLQNSTDLREGDNFCLQTIYRKVFREASKSLAIFKSRIEPHNASCFWNSVTSVDSN